MQDGVASTPFRLRPNAREADQLRELNPVHIDPAVLHGQPESDRRGGVC